MTASHGCSRREARPDPDRLRAHRARGAGTDPDARARPVGRHPPRGAGALRPGRRSRDSPRYGMGDQPPFDSRLRQPARPRPRGGARRARAAEGIRRPLNPGRRLLRRRVPAGRREGEERQRARGRDDRAGGRWVLGHVRAGRDHRRDRLHLAAPGLRAEIPRGRRPRAAGDGRLHQRAPGPARRYAGGDHRHTRAGGGRATRPRARCERRAPTSGTASSGPRYAPSRTVRTSSATGCATSASLRVTAFPCTTGMRCSGRRGPKRWNGRSSCGSIELADRDAGANGGTRSTRCVLATASRPRTS